MNMYKWCEQVLHTKDRMPVPIMTHPGIEELGYTVRQAITDGEIHAKAVKYLAETFPSKAGSVIMDLTVEAEAFGADVLFPEDEIATVTGHMLNNAEDIHNLKVPELTAGRIPQYIKANILAHEQLSRPSFHAKGSNLSADGITYEQIPLFAGCIGPFSLAGRLYDMSEIMMLIYSDPDAAHELLEKCTEFILKYCAALKATGVEGVVMAEPAAGLMSNDDCKEFSSKYIKQIVERLQDEKFIIVLHNCGNTGHCTEAMVMTGAKALHLGNKCDIVQILEDTPENIIVMGNLDPVSVFKMQSPEEVYESAMELLRRTEKYPHFVISSGCDTPPHVPLENVAAFYKAVEDYNLAPHA